MSAEATAQSRQKTVIIHSTVIISRHVVIKGRHFLGRSIVFIELSNPSAPLSPSQQPSLKIELHVPGAAITRIASLVLLNANVHVNREAIFYALLAHSVGMLMRTPIWIAVVFSDDRPARYSVANSNMDF